MTRNTGILLGHVFGLALSLIAAAQAPRVMDSVICLLGIVGIANGPATCAFGSAGLGEGGVALTLAAVLSLAGLVVIMEVVVRLGRWYRAPGWCPPLVAFIGCPAMLFAIMVLHDSPPGTVDAEGALVLGIPVALAFTAYWIPLALLRRAERRPEVGVAC